MTASGKLIVIEGVDGSGKRTQTELLSRALTARGIACLTVSFPHYDSFFGRMIGRFLNGEFGDLDAVDPHFAALLYAGDRLEAKPQLESALAAGKTILADRYVASNLAHQGARVAPDKRGRVLGVAAASRIRDLRTAQGIPGRVPARAARAGPAPGGKQGRAHLHHAKT